MSGALLDYGRTRYQPPQDLIDHVIARDQRCMFAGCNQPAWRNQLDHTIAYPNEPTADTNLGRPCGPHHNGKTHGGWQLEQPETGRFRWTSPTGHRYETGPTAVGPITDEPVHGEPEWAEPPPDWAEWFGPPLDSDEPPPDIDEP